MTMPHSVMDRISKRLQTRSSSSRYGDFTFDSSPRRRRRNGRHSSVCVSSAESTPLFNTPAPNQGQVLMDAKSQPSPWRSAIDPLATSSLMLATGELDRLTNRKISDRSSGVLGSGQSSDGGGPPNSPAMKSLASSEKPSLRLDTTGFASEGSTTPRNPLPQRITMRSGNSIPQSTAHVIRRQRMTSSRFSDIRTPENILEVSNEDVSPTTCTPGELCTPSSPNSESQSLYASLANPTKIAESGCTIGSGLNLPATPVNRFIKQTHLTKNEPSKNFGESTGGQHESTPAFNDKIPLSDSGQPQTCKGTKYHLHAGALTPQNTRGLWCPPRKSPSPPRRHSMRDPNTPTG